jgi:hypothetical protein
MNYKTPLKIIAWYAGLGSWRRGVKLGRIGIKGSQSEPRKEQFAEACTRLKLDTKAIAEVERRYLFLKRVTGLLAVLAFAIMIGVLFIGRYLNAFAAFISTYVLVALYLQKCFRLAQIRARDLFTVREFFKKTNVTQLFNFWD